MGLAMKDWNKQAKTILKAELARADSNYEDLAVKLKAIGVEETYSSLAAKINRGTFSFAFFVQCMAALGVSVVRFGE